MTGKVWYKNAFNTHAGWKVSKYGVKIQIRNNSVFGHISCSVNEGKSAFAERFIRILKSKIYKYMISVSKNVYMDKLDNIVT